MAKIIIIDDEPAMVEVIVTLCRDKGHQVFPFSSAAKAVEQMESINPEIVITDVKMETMSGFDVLRHVKENHKQTLVILITAYASVDTAIEAMKMGAHGYVPKPFKIDELQMTIQRALEFQSARQENTYLRKELKNRYKFENIIGSSRKMQIVYNLINKVADTDSTVLIQGESGTGKELVARGLHFNSNRSQHPFVAINCSALPENLLESELFGHKKGAFTGAVADKRGLFEEANLGTIFLDEVNSMATSLQTKLLRVLQEREVRRVGDNKSVPVNVRVVCATNEALQPKIRDGTFREDLYYRLAVIPVENPTVTRTARRRSLTRESFPPETGDPDWDECEEDRPQSSRVARQL
jgi:DNA-binding NtrC family response regulator